jgi:hypothetical protein
MVTSKEVREFAENNEWVMTDLLSDLDKLSPLKKEHLPQHDDVFESM